MPDAVKFGITYAKLLKDGTVKFCSGYAHFRWMQFGPGQYKSKLEYNLVGLYSIETKFSGQSHSLDGPHLWWTITVKKHASPPNRKQKDLSGGLLPAILDTVAPRCRSLKEIFDSPSDSVYSKSFSTKEQALDSHAEALKVIRAHMRQSPGPRLEPSQELLAQLSYWCEQGWGRQTKVAKAVHVSPQRVNDWINGRKKMTADQALLALEFLNLNTKSRRKRSS
jgi:predicted XRE-type DNA-binding protein